jgi:cation:H+ antiporter
MQILLIILGLLLVTFGSNWLVDGASALAKKLKVSDLVVGLTIVSFGTSAPELIVNIFASANGSTELAIGNVVGSNIFNLLFILGVSAIVYPITVHNYTVFREIPFSLLAAAVIAIAANDIFIDGNASGIISRSDGLILLCFFSIFMYYVFIISRSSDVHVPEGLQTMSTFKSLLYITAGLSGLVFGGKLMVDSAVILARNMGVSESVIGLTVLAIGTSIPELATSVAAAFKKNSDIAIGNVVGSNIFNIFFILGTSAVIKPLPFQAASNVDLILLFFATVFMLLLVYNHRQQQMVRTHGIIFVAIYILYTVYLLLYRA